MTESFQELIQLSESTEGINTIFDHENDNRVTSSEEMEDIFTIDKDMPEPIRNISYDIILKLNATMRRLNPGESFPINRELRYPVLRLRIAFFPEYKLRILPTGEKFRVFRRS